MLMLATEGSVVIATSALDLDVSEMTIRSDLIELEERGVARRVRGGALALGPQTFAERKQSRSRAKAQIAAKLRPFIPLTGTVAFELTSPDGGAWTFAHGQADTIVRGTARPV